MSSLKALGWGGIAFGLLTSAVSVGSQEGVIRPPSVRRLTEHLAALRGPLSFSVVRETRVLPRTKEPGAAGTANQVFDSWIQAVRAGVPPRIEEVWSFALQEVPTRAQGLEATYQGGFFWVDHAQAGDSLLSVTKSQESFLNAALSTQGLTMTYRHATGEAFPDQVSAFRQESGRHADTNGIRTLISPLSTEPYYAKMLEGGAWTVEGEGSWTTLEMESPRGSGNTLTLGFMRGEQLPSVALDVLVSDDESEGDLFVLSFFKRSNCAFSASGPLQLFEVLRIDSLAFEGVVLVERIVVLQSTWLKEEQGGPSLDEVFKLPVSWTGATQLRDWRTPEAARVYGPDVSTWPGELLNLMRSR